MNQEAVLQQHIVKANSFLRLFLWLMLLVSLGLAQWNQTWSAALFLGIPFAVIPTLLIATMPQALVTRLVVSTALLLFCALHIYQARGMTEVHFGIFVTLSLLLVYQDWRIIILGGAVIAVHHLLFNFLQQAGYGEICFTTPGIGITLLHAVYVVAECVALSYLAILLRKQTDATLSQLRLQTSFDHMRCVVEQSQQGVDAIRSAASEISNGNADLSARTESQMSSLAQTIRTMENLMLAVGKNSDHSHDANKLVTSASEIAVSGGKMVTQVVDTMVSIRESSRRIVDIISVIDGIAFQTNILALNAAVEAARAGEQGRGFAVVASEVRSLAQRSATAAKEIKALITDSGERIETGGRLVDTTGQTMAHLVTSVQQVAVIMSEINAASASQREGIGQVNQAISDMAASTQQNTALVDIAASASDSLRDHATHLASLLASLNQPVPTRA
jgi:methyl-accepting chemotaxis protein